VGIIRIKEKRSAREVVLDLGKENWNRRIERKKKGLEVSGPAGFAEVGGDLGQTVRRKEERGAKQ